MVARILIHLDGTDGGLVWSMFGQRMVESDHAYKSLIVAFGVDVARTLQQIGWMGNKYSGIKEC